MSFTSGLGYLGTNILGSSSADARATGLRGILTNQTTFGPDGVVAVSYTHLDVYKRQGGYHRGDCRRD